MKLFKVYSRFKFAKIFHVQGFFALWAVEGTKFIFANARDLKLVWLRPG
jgi:hypothetical protein